MSQYGVNTQMHELTSGIPIYEPGNFDPPLLYELVNGILDLS